MRINKKTANAVLLQEAKHAEQGSIDPLWKSRFELFSKICDEATRTHIAFLGTALLAKAVDLRVDVWAVKARKGQTTYSARGLGHSVLVPNALMLGINLGVTGREPLNNQPYFHVDRLSRQSTVHGKAREALSSLCDILDEVEKLDSLERARLVLRAFIYVRRQWNPVYSTLDLVAAKLDLRQLIERVTQFTGEDSEGGKRAQAIVAGTLDLVAGPESVLTTRVNDPDRHLPGDVGVRMPGSKTVWQRVFEVRDKVVEASDLYHFAKKAVANEVAEAAIVAAASGQRSLDSSELSAAWQWAWARGVNLTLFLGWKAFLQQALFWAPVPAAQGLQALPQLIFQRLVELEASPEGTERWRQLTTEAKASDLL